MQLEKLPSIWNESPLTIPYVSKGATIDRSKRFELNSIYHKDDPHKPKKQVDQLLFPMKILQDFRKNIKEAGSKSKQKVIQKRAGSVDEEDDVRSGIGKRADSITKRLYHKPEMVKEERDQFGNRCSMNQKQFQDVIKLPSFAASSNRHKSIQKLYVTTSQRLNLGRPINFNPGPGTYLKQTINEQNHIKPKLSASVHLQSSMLSGLKKKGRDKYTLQSIQTRNMRSCNQ